METIKGYPVSCYKVPDLRYLSHEIVYCEQYKGILS